MTETTRGQSETVGVVLLTAVVVVSVSVLGVGILSSSGPQAADKPLIDADIEITTNSVTITHGGGDSVDGRTVDVVVRNRTASQRYASVDGGRFEPTDTVTLSHSLNGTVTVLVVHTDSNYVVGRESRTLYPDDPLASELPAVDSASLPDTPINDSEANANVERTLTLTFDESMNQSVAPTIDLVGVTTSSADLLAGSGSWTTPTTYEVPIRFADNDVDTTVDVEVSDATDTDGNEMVRQTPLSFVIDTRSPGDPNNVVIEPTAITLANQHAVDVTVTDPDSLDGDETAVVTLEDQTGATITKEKVIDASTSETTLTFDAVSLADGTVTPSAFVKDDVGNTGDTVTNDQTPKDTVAPSVDSLTATEQDSRTFTVTLEATEETSIYADDVTLDVSGPGTVENTEQLTLDNSGSSFTYEVRYTVSRRGEYTVSLTKLEDAYGNDGASGQSTSAVLGDAADFVTYAGDAATFGTDNSGVSLSLQNSVAKAFSVQNVTVSTNAADTLYEGNSGDGRTNHEIRVVASTTEYYDTPKERNANQDGYDLQNPVPAPLSNPASISGESTAELTLYEFLSSGGGGPPGGGPPGGGSSGDPVDMTGNDVTVTVGFSDGSELTFTVTP